MPTAKATPTTTASRKPRAVSSSVTRVCSRTIQCFSAITAPIWAGEGISQSGTWRSRTTTSQTTTRPTKNTAPRTMRAVGRPSDIRGLLLPESPADAAGQAREFRRVLHEQVAGPGQVHRHDVDDPARPGRHDDHAVGEDDRLHDVVRDEEHRALPLLPEAEQLEAHLLPRQGVERAERLVHEQERGLGDEGAAESDPLLHPSRELERVLA